MTATNANEQPFFAIDRAQIWAQVADQIKAMILSGTLKPGDKLPNERELCRRMEVSRMSLRESLRTLQNEGYVEVRPGLGTFVLGPDSYQTKSLTAWINQHENHLQKLLELRLVVEPGIAAIAARKATAADADKLVATIAAMQRAVDSASAQAATDADIRFHITLAEMTGNSLLVGLVSEIMSMTNDLRAVTLSSPQALQAAIDGHTRVAEAIRAGDENAARTAMLAHMHDAHDWIRRQQGLNGHAGLP